MKIPVIRRTHDETLSTPAPSRRLSGEIASVIKTKTNDSPDYDWKTITTNPILEPPRPFAQNIIQGTGSSLADVSDADEYNFCECEYGSTERITQHPQLQGQDVQYRVRTDKQTARPVLLPSIWRTQQSGFFQNSNRQIPQPSSRAAEAIRRFSNSLRHDACTERSDPPARNLDLKGMSRGYDSRSSETGADGQFNKIASHKEPRFYWSRIHESFRRTPAADSLTTFDQPLHRIATHEQQPALDASHVARNEILKGIPRLPFPLVSLPEAAKLQQFRRERGEEDHTEYGGTFSAKARSGTVSSIASSHCPRTPVSACFDSPGSNWQYSLPVPPAKLQSQSRVYEVRRRTAGWY